VPFLVADFAESNGDLIGDLLFSLQRVGVSGDAATVHDYLAQLRLPGDDDVLAEVASLRGSLMGAENEAARLKHFRLLVGPLQDTALEELVIETLNEILAGSGYKAEDRPEASGEDFGW